MPKSLRHYRRRNNKTQRLRKGNSKLTGGYKVFPDDHTDLHELKELLGQPDRHLFALHSDEKSCGYCKQFKPEWNKVLARLTPHPNMTVAKLGPTATDYMNEHHYRHHNHAVNGVPTIIYYIVNNKPREYDGERTADKIIAWLSNVMADNNLELTIKPKSQDDAHEAPASVPLSEVPDLDSASVPLSEAASVPLPEQADAQTAFPQAPLPPASTLSNAADTIRTTAANVDDKISQGVSAIKSALTSDLDLGSLFSSSSSSDAVAAPAVAAPAVAVNAVAVAAPNADLVPNPVNVPQVPSLVGGRRRTRRKHRRSKSPKRSKKSRSKK